MLCFIISIKRGKFVSSNNPIENNDQHWKSFCFFFNSHPITPFEEEPEGDNWCSWKWPCHFLQSFIVRVSVSWMTLLVYAFPSSQFFFILLWFVGYLGPLITCLHQNWVNFSHCISSWSAFLASTIHYIH